MHRELSWPCEGVVWPLCPPPLPIVQISQVTDPAVWCSSSTDAAIVLLLHHIWNIWSREHRTLPRIPASNEEKYRPKIRPSLPGRINVRGLIKVPSFATDYESCWRHILPASARVCGERWSDPGPPPVIPPPAPSQPRVLRELRAITRAVSRALAPASGLADIWLTSWAPGDLLMTSWAPSQVVSLGQTPWWELTCGCDPGRTIFNVAVVTIHYPEHWGQNWTRPPSHMTTSWPPAWL